jgi:hypothetical protein
MKHGGKMTILALASALSGAAALAASAPASDDSGASGRYQSIPLRNVFNLHPPPAPPSAEELAEKNKPPVPKITLTGITTILGKKIAFLSVPPTAPKPGTPPGAPQSNSMMLTEGQGQDDIEVTQIDEKAAIVKVINHGEPQTLDFDHDGVKSSGAPQQPGGNPAMPAALPPRPSLPPRNVLPNNDSPAPIRPIRPMSRNSGLGGNGFGGGMNPLNSGQQTERSLTAEESAALIEIQRMKYHQEGDPTEKILPPTEATDAINGPAPQ